MATTWGDIKSSIRDAMRDRSQGFISDDELLRSLRRVLRHVDQASAFAFQETSGVITVNSNTTDYDLAVAFPDFKEVLSVTTQTSATSIPFELQYTNLKDFQLVGDGLAFTIKGTSLLELYGPTASALSNSQLTVFYYSRFFFRDSITNALKEFPTIDADYVTFPERFVDVIVEGLLMYVFRKDRSHREDYTDAKSEFDAQILKMVMEESRRVKRSTRYARAPF